MQNDYRAIWEDYTASWKAETAEEKRALYDKALNPACVYTDPLTRAAGWDEIDAYMREFHRQIPGGHFVTVEFSAHHARSVARWEMRDGSGNLKGTGISYGEYGTDGKLTAMTGFFEVGADAA